MWGKHNEGHFMFSNQGAKGFFIVAGKITPVPPGADFLLLETPDDFFLLEDGDKLILG